MKKTIASVISALTICAASSAYAIDNIADPQKYLKTYYWGDLYKGGGTTFYCNKPFKKKNVLVDESYIYSDSWIRDHLMCGTPRQCRKDNEQYKKMITDMHNIYPAKSRFELRRKNAKFEELGEEVPLESCGERRSFLIIDPPNAIRGDIARSLFYMHKTYSLPFVGFIDQLKRWHRLDPASPEEKERNNRIKALQGNDNPFITDPSLAETL